MAVRVCPHCNAEVSAPFAAAYSYGFDCPKCGTRLEVAPAARTISSLCGLVAGAIAWRLSNGMGGDLGAVLPTLFAFLAFGIASPLVLMATANLRNAPLIPVHEPVHAHDHPAEQSGGDH